MRPQPGASGPFARRKPTTFPEAGNRRYSCDPMPPSKKVGTYEIAEEIGVGGFGVVYKAWDPYIQRWVALKVCNARDHEATQRFFREAQLAGALQHPNITLIYDFGIEDETPFFVQEFLSGQDLDELLERGRMTRDAALGVLLQVCAGLAFAHSRGIIHRDIKPANVRILEDGTVKIMDFGIATSMTAEAHLAQSGAVLGTAGYLAPEQLSGKPVDARTDLFSLGVMAYELLAGARPFVGSNLSDVIDQILHHTPLPLRQRDPECPERLERAVLTTLAKEPSARFASITEFAHELKQIQDAAASDTSPARANTTTAVVRAELGRLLATPSVEPTAMTELAIRPLDRIASSVEAVRAKRPRWATTVLALAGGLALLAGGWWVLAQRGLVSGARLFAEPAPSPIALAIPSPAPTAIPTPSPVTIALFVDPPSDIEVDGKRLGKLATGSVTLMPGRHVVLQRIPGYREKTYNVDVAAATSKLVLRLPSYGYLSVLNDFDVSVQGSKVYIDGRPVGALPLRDRKVEAGRHALRVTWPGGGAYSSLVVVPTAASLDRVVHPE
jgi:eukaryotic-like serine/threonine-protein kinase